jgi:copper chaperone CopZ
MKTFFFFIAVVLSLATAAQVTKVTLQASGLTCSMCSNSINKSLKTIAFVDNVKANIKTSSFDITFKPNAKVDFDLLKKKVEDAGFTIANFVAAVNFDNIQVKSNQPVKVGDKTFYIINAKDQALNGTRQVRLIDKGFVSNKEYKKNTLAGTSSGNGVYNVTI